MLKVLLLAALSLCSVEQNGGMNERCVYTLNGTNLVARNVKNGREHSCASAPLGALEAASLETSGCQHLVLKSAAGEPMLVYHTVTDQWFDYQSIPPPKRFSATAWVVVGIYFGIVGLMAWHFIRKQKNADDYFRGGQRIPWYVAGVSIFATMLSSLSFLAAPAQIYLYDCRYQVMTFFILLVVPVISHFYLPFYRKLNVTSAYEYLEKRFNLGVRLFGSGAFAVYMVARIAIVTLLPAIAIHAVTGVNVDLCIVICGIVMIVYTALGGLEAVVWSDFVQGIVLLGGAVAITISLIMKTDGGLPGMLSIAAADAKLTLIDTRWSLVEPTLVLLIIQGLIMNFSSYTSDQCVIQRYMAVKDIAAARRSLWFNGFLSTGASFLFAIMGVALYTHYKCHPQMLDIAMPKADGIVPGFMASEMHPVVAGLVIAGIFAATISTLSANLSSAATALTTDFVRRFRPTISSERLVRTGQVFSVIVGVIGVGAAFVLSRVDTYALFDNFIQFLSILTSGLMAMFFIGIFMKRVRGNAAVLGLVVNYLVCIALTFAPLPFARPHQFLVGGAGFLAAVLVAYLASFIVPEDNRDLTGLTWSLPIFSERKLTSPR